MGKKSLFLLLPGIIFGMMTGWAQTDCWTINSVYPANYPSGISAYNCLEINQGVIQPPPSVPSNQNYDIVSATRITVSGESVISPGTALANRLLIDVPVIGVRRISPATGGVPRYEKLEYGITLPPEAETRIANFVNKVPNATKLNPFDPLDVDIQADFEWEVDEGDWQVKGRQYGFYYREYVLDTTGQSMDWHRDEVSVPEKFRVRYAPTEEGNWRVKFTVFLNGIGTYTTLYHYFTAVPSSNPGYLKVADGGKYFELGNDVFYPLGQNQPYPECVSQYCMDMDTTILKSPDAQWSGEPWLGGTKSPVKSYRMYHRVLEKMKAGGANYFRMLINQWGLEIEFEELGNYYDRMEQAWEMDLIMDKAHEQGLYMTWNMLLHTPFEVGNVNWEQSWDFGPDGCYDAAWCYDGIPGVDHPTDVLTNATAKRYYKNRLRYLVSRYGYSTNIGLMELVSEINNIGQGYTYYPTLPWGCTRDEISYVKPSYVTNFAVVVPQVQAWQQYMLSYIKNDLGHTEHLTGVSYTGQPSNSDHIYSSPLVDYIGFNNYSGWLNRFEYINGGYKKYRDTIGLVKPLFNSEIGAGGDFLICDGMSDWIRNIWIMPFTGFAGAGMSWGHMFHLGFPKMQVYGYLGQFLQGVDFRDASGITWEPVQDVRNDKKSETYAMRGEYGGDNRRAIGVVINRSYNYHTMGTDTDCTELDSLYLDDMKFVPFNMSPLNVAWEGAPNRLKLPGMGLWKNYTIDWYNCWTGQWMAQTEKTSDIAGDLYLEHPELSGDAEQPLIAYKIYPKNEAKKASLDTLVQTIPFIENEENRERMEARKITELHVYPNPATDLVYIAVPTEMEGMAWQLTSMSGTALKNGMVRSGINSVSIAELKSGIYLLTLNGNNTQIPQTFKLIKP